MRKVKYGTKTIEYNFREADNLNTHYIEVEKGKGVTLKGEAVSESKEKKLILKKARWIIEKLKLVESAPIEAIVTGSRLPYLGRRFYTEIIIDESLSVPKVIFNYSKFKIYLPSMENAQSEIKDALSVFYRTKAKEKIEPRLKMLSKQTDLKYNELKLRSLEKRWGSCTSGNNIVINIEAIKLPFSLIDYLLIHELCHTKVKNHSKAFWAEVSKHVDNWRALDERMSGWAM